jgi:hypothetical protein
MGRQGSGPGEFQNPRGIELHGDTLAVLDIGNLRVVNFLIDRGYVSVRPLPNGSSSRRFTLLDGDTILTETAGNDDALAILRAPDGSTLARYGTPLAKPENFIFMSKLRESIARGEVPDAFKNNVIPVWGQNHDVWLVQQTTGVVQRLGRNGQVLATTALSPHHVDERRREFFRLNKEELKEWIWQFGVAQDAIATPAGLWLSLRQPDSLPLHLVLYDTLGHVIEDELIPSLPGNAGVIYDPWREGMLFYDPSTDALLRPRRQ